MQYSDIRFVISICIVKHTKNALSVIIPCREGLRASGIDWMRNYPPFAYEDIGGVASVCRIGMLDLDALSFDVDRREDRSGTKPCCSTLPCRSAKEL